MLVRLFLSFEEMWLPQNSGSGSDDVEEVWVLSRCSGGVPALEMPCSVGQCGPQESTLPVIVTAHPL